MPHVSVASVRSREKLYQAFCPELTTLFVLRLCGNENIFLYCVLQDTLRDSLSETMWPRAKWKYTSGKYDFGTLRIPRERLSYYYLRILSDAQGGSWPDVFFLPLDSDLFQIMSHGVSTARRQKW